MSRAEERACQYTGYCKNQSYSDFLNGYHQAEKELELGWEDIKEICVQSVLVEVDLGGLVSDERHYTEVLKRFKAQKGERNEKNNYYM